MAGDSTVRGDTGADFVMGASARARHDAITAPATLPWILRLGVAGCFIGHGAFGVITKAAWVPYFAVGGISEPMAWQLMPWIGWMDISMGVLALLWPCRALLAWAVVWTIWTALCRPLAGEPFWETLERAGNYGVPLALLVVASWHGGWWTRLTTESLAPTATNRARLNWTLRLTACILLVGHAGLGFFSHKVGLTQHYAALWSEAPASAVIWVGVFEFLLAAAVLLQPAPALLFAICAWKLATESLFLVAGAPGWELLERAGSYAAPLALAVSLLQVRRQAGACRSTPTSLPSTSQTTCESSC